MHLNEEQNARLRKRVVEILPMVKLCMLDAGQNVLAQSGDMGEDFAKINAYGHCPGMFPEAMDICLRMARGEKVDDETLINTWMQVMLNIFQEDNEEEVQAERRKGDMGPAAPGA